MLSPQSRKHHEWSREGKLETLASSGGEGTQISNIARPIEAMILNGIKDAQIHRNLTDLNRETMICVPATSEMLRARLLSNIEIQHR